MLDAVQTPEVLRCPLCNKQRSNLKDLNKHFRELHEREHKKRLQGPRYRGSDKEKRYWAAVENLGLPRSNLAGKKGQAVQLLLQQADVKLIQVPNTNQAADEAIKSNIKVLLKQLPSLQDSVLVVVSDDRGFRGDVHSFLQAGGAGVMLVTARHPGEWDAAGGAFSNTWLMREDERVAFVGWDDILYG